MLIYKPILFVDVVASDMKAIDSVLKADKKRLDLLAEEKKLMDETNAGNTENSERLEQVGVLTL